MNNLRFLKRWMIIFGDIFLALSLFVAIRYPAYYEDICPYAKYVVIAVHSFSFISCFLIIFKLDWNYLLLFVLVIESTMAILTNNPMIALILFISFIVLAYCFGFFKEKIKQKCIGLIIYWFLILNFLLIIDKRSYFLSLGASLYFLFFFQYIFHVLETKFSTYLNADAKLNYSLPQPGSELHLSDLDISDREKQIIKALRQDKGYQQISEEIYYSVSTVKKDVSHICDYFMVREVNELKRLLFQYIIVD